MLTKYRQNAIFGVFEVVCQHFPPQVVIETKPVKFFFAYAGIKEFGF
jgi:hypothetical protein